MEVELIHEINENVATYLKEKDESNLIEIGEQLQLLQFQIQNLRYTLRIIVDKLESVNRRTG